MEKSRAIKCPSAGLHLAGTKRVQVQLSRPGILEKFVDSDVAEKLRQLFVSQYTLNEVIFFFSILAFIALINHPKIN